MKVEVAKAAVLAMTEANERSRMPTTGATTRSRSGGPSHTKPIFNLDTRDKYTEFRHFQMEVTNIFLRKHYHFTDAQKVTVIKTS